MMLGYSRIGDQLRSTVETFCACTALPIAAFSDDGTVFGYAGTHLPDALGLDKLRLTHADIKRFISQVDRITWPLNLTVEVNPDLQLTAVPITTGSRSMGMYIIGPFSRTRLRACIPFLLGLLQSIQGSKFSLHDSFPTNLHVRRAVRYVYEHYRETITLESMAAQLGINKSYLAHVFRAELGETFTEFVNRFRVEMSKAALQDSREPILNVALQHGFTSQNYYGRVFKKLTGITPSEFRKRSQGRGLNPAGLLLASAQ
jgi:AraC-like DNA-binding protein